MKQKTKNLIFYLFLVIIMLLSIVIVKQYKVMTTEPIPEEVTYEFVG